MVFVLSYPINQKKKKKIIENYLSEEMTRKKSECSLHMKFKILLFSKQKINMMTWSTNINNTSVQVAAEFWMVKQN